MIVRRTLVKCDDSLKRKKRKSKISTELKKAAPNITIISHKKYVITLGGTLVKHKVPSGTGYFNGDVVLAS